MPSALDGILDKLEQDVDAETEDIENSVKMNRGLSTVLNSAHKSHLDTLFEDRLT